MSCTVNIVCASISYLLYTRPTIILKAWRSVSIAFLTVLLDLVGEENIFGIRLERELNARVFQKSTSL